VVACAQLDRASPQGSCRLKPYWLQRRVQQVARHSTLFGHGSSQPGRRYMVSAPDWGATPDDRGATPTPNAGNPVAGQPPTAATMQGRGANIDMTWVLDLPTPVGGQPPTATPTKLCPRPPPGPPPLIMIVAAALALHDPAIRAQIGSSTIRATAPTRRWGPSPRDS
jgi:hypothetical protein